MHRHSLRIVAGLVVVVVFATQGFGLPTPYLFLNTQGGAAFRGHIDQVNRDGTGRTTLLDVEPGAFGNINAWRGFATDGKFYYFLNTQGGPAFRGHVDRLNLDGTGRTTIFDLSPSVFTDGVVGQHKGMATDGRFFYFLNVNGPNPQGGQITRTAMDGSGATVLYDIESSLFNNINDWHGFAADGDFFYVLNTQNNNATFNGRVDRFNLDGTGRTALINLGPSPFSNISAWRGFAIAPAAVPEPATLSLLTIAGLALLRRKRRAA